MPVTPAQLDQIHAQLDVTHHRRLGTITDGMIRSYARAIRDDSRLRYDADYARSRGYGGVVSSPNFITSVIDWDEGPATEQLNEDGTGGANLPGIDLDGVRLMGGGERNTLHTPVVAGTVVDLSFTLVSVRSREGREGPFVVLTYDDRFVRDDGEPLLTSERTLLLR